MFKKQSMEKIADNPKSTPLAIILIVIGAVIASSPDIYRYLVVNSSNVLPNSSIISTKMTYLVRTLIIFFFILSFTFSLAGSTNTVLKLFDGSSTFKHYLKAVGFTEIFFLIGSLANLLLTIIGLGFIGNIISFISFLFFITTFITVVTMFSSLTNIKVAIIVIFSFIIAFMIAVIIVSVFVLVPLVWYSLTNPPN